MTPRDWYAEWVIANYESWLAEQWRARRTTQMARFTERA
jgi:hypothetical protein